MNNYYQPSGKFSPLAFAYFAAVVCIGIPLAALLYVYAIWYIPFIYVSFLLTAGFGFVVGWLLQRAVIQPGKVRNTTLAMLLGVLGGLAAVYVQWVVWLDMVINTSGHLGNERLGVSISTVSPGQLLPLLFSPGVVASLMGEVNQVGTWGIRGATVSGFFLAFIWVIEALIISVIPLLMASARARMPFCEISQTWYKEKDLPAIQYIEDPQAVIALLERNDAAAEAHFQKTVSLTDKHSVLTLYYAPSEMYYLSITNKTPKYNDKGELSFEDTLVMPPLSIDSRLGRKLVDECNQQLKTEQETVVE